MGKGFFEFRIKTVLCAMRIVSKLPLKFHYFCGDILSWIMKNVLHYRYNVVLTNISRSFPEKNYYEVKKIASDFYRHLGEIIAEAIWFSGSDYRRIHSSGICRYTNLEVLCEAYENSPSVTVLFSHCGNWELIGGLWCFNYDPKVDYPCEENHIKVVYKRLHSRFWDEVFVRNRIHPLKNYDGPIESRNILRYAIKHRDVRNVYIYPTDQYPYAASHDVGSFLNQPSKVMLGSAALAHKLGMNVLYLRMKQVSRARYEMTFVPICRNAAEMEPEAIMRKYLDLLEEDIRETPHNWLWSHKRWKK